MYVEMSVRIYTYIHVYIYNSSKHQPNNVRSVHVNLLSQIFGSSLAGIRTHATVIS